MPWNDSLFYAVFLGQIFLLSWYFPEKIHARMKYVLATYPPDAYPKLYPRPVEHYRIGHWVYRLINRLVLGLGLLILLALLFLVDHGSFADDGYISEFWPALYGFVQFIPLLVLEIGEFHQFKQMRQANTTSRRTADLRRRTLLVYVSPTLFIAAVFLYLGAVLLLLHADEWGAAIWLTAGMLFMAGVGAFNLYGQKKDPHQSTEDRSRHISAALHSVIYVSMALSVFYIMTALDQMFDLDYLDATMLSLYFQAIIWLSVGHMLRSIRLEDLNFEVYRADPAAT
ncbi:MAG: hypothetical protein QNJ40_03285 [Xanthomonadales bacterium]|nr:hypothetical protein [Xanthomonadales bacterium]